MLLCASVSRSSVRRRRYLRGHLQSKKDDVEGKLRKMLEEVGTVG